jgi:type I restriction enzyme, S subunit
MEEVRGYIMVNTLMWVSLPVNDIISNDYRYEAGCYNIDVLKNKELLANLGLNLSKLSGENGISDVSYPNRFKRIYVEKSDYPLILPSQIMEVKIKTINYISKRTLDSFDHLKVGPNELLLTRSGTIGKIRYTTNSMKDLILSDDIIRIKPKNPIDAAYIYAYIRSDIGQNMLSLKPYGAVIKHIEPDHLNNYMIPYPDDKTRKAIGEKIIKSYELRDKSNDLVDLAENLLIDNLGLSPLDKIRPLKLEKDISVKNFSVKSNELNERFEAKYHDPIIESIERRVRNTESELIPLGDKRLSEKIILPGRFKRFYVEKDNGAVFLGGKQIYELDPYNKKYLSLKKHRSRIESQLFLHENMIAITCSGTIGRVNLIPKHWEDWTMSQHVIRIIPANKDIAGYISLAKLRIW